MLVNKMRINDSFEMKNIVNQIIEKTKNTLNLKTKI